jgi:uncharacterized membrane protein
MEIFIEASFDGTGHFFRIYNLNSNNTYFSDCVLSIYLRYCALQFSNAIRIDADNVSVVDAREDGPQLCFPWAWLKIVHTGDPEGWYPSRLFIGSHGKYIEIGKYLIESERETLANNLRCTIEGA